MLLALLAIPLPPGPAHPAALVAGCALTLGVAGSAVFLPWKRLPRWTDALPPLVYLLAAALLREGEAAGASTYALLLLLPVAWLAAYGTRAQLAAAVAGVAAVTTLPILIWGAPDYPDGEWRRAFVLVAISGVFGFAGQRLMNEGRRQAAMTRLDAANIAAVLEATRELARSTTADSARTAICEAAKKVAGAALAMLYEPDPDGRELRVTGSFGSTSQSLLETARPFVGSSSGEVRSFSSVQPVFVADADDESTVSRELREAGARSCLFQPVVRDGRSIGVLMVAWKRRVPQPPDRLPSVLSLLAAEAAVAIERADLLARLEMVARTDDLTGLANRRAWDEQLPLELARAVREEWSVCVAMLDLDHFKDFNDKLGHQAGDRLLKASSAAWRTQLRATDTLTRYGGEEFAIVLPNCSLEDATELLERVRTATPAGQTASAGVAAWDGVEEPGILVSRADAALYQAKESGRDRVIVAAR
jgi:diguanylate cyclase (GGDEF)-like protein